MPLQGKNLLLIKIRAMGDTLLATPALSALRRAYPQGRITAMVSPAGREILEGNPDVDEILIYNKNWPWWRQIGFIWQLAGRGWNSVLVLHASFRTALLAWLTRAPVRVVNNHSGRDYFATIPLGAKKEAKSTIQRDLDAVRALGVAAENTTTTFLLRQVHYEHAHAFLQAQQIGQSRPFMLLAPGSNARDRRWNSAAAVSFLAHIERLLPVDWILLAGPADEKLVQDIHAEAVNHPPVFSADIKSAGALMVLSQGLVAVNSGPKHVAVAVGTPTLTLWTDEPETEWHPYDRVYHALLRPSTGRLEDLAPERVATQVQQHFEKVWKIKTTGKNVGELN